MNMTGTPLVRTRVVLLLSLLLVGCGQQSPDLHGNPYETPPQAADLPLFDLEGNSFSLENQKGQILLLFFGYSKCPDVCPPTLHNIAWIFDELGESASGVSLIFVSIDPARDTPEELGNYLEAFDPRFIGLLGDEEQTFQLARGYGVFFAREDALEGSLDESSDSYLIAHTDRIFLIGPEGRLLSNYPFETPRTEILEDLVILLGQDS